MKPIILALIVLLCSCGGKKQNIERPKREMLPSRVMDSERGVVQVVTIDGCEYITWDRAAGSGVIIHKENCKNHDK